MRIFRILLHLLQGALIGLGAVLPGISGGVLSVVFGVYKPLIELLSDPGHKYKTHLRRLSPYLLGYAIGFMGVANLLAYFLEKYPAPSVCLFVGLIAGMLPSLWREAGLHGRSKGSLVSMALSMIVVFALLISLNAARVSITPNFSWYLFCGFCLALSIIAPGMSFSTLLMPLNLYTSFVDGIGHLTPEVIVPAGIGAAITFFCLPKAVNSLFDNHYSLAFHGIMGVVIAATLMTVPFESFTLSTNACLINVFFLAAGAFTASVLDVLNSKVPREM